MRTRLFLITFILLLQFMFLPLARAQVPQMINYQGRLVIGGTNYNGSGPFKFALVDAGTNTSRTATATCLSAGGYVVSYTVTYGGSGYVTPPTVTVTDATGTGATAIAYIGGGVVTNIDEDNLGDGNYSLNPTVTLSDPPVVLGYITYWSNDGTPDGEPTNAVTLSVNKGLFSVRLGDTNLANMTALPSSLFTNTDLRLRIWFDGGGGFQQLTPDHRIVSVSYAMRADGVAAGAITSGMLADNAVTSSKIASNTIQAVHMAVGSVGSTALASNAVTSTHIAAGAVTTQELATVSTSSSSVEMRIPTPIADERFGQAVARIDAGKFIVGAPERDAGASGAGGAYVYDTSGNCLTTVTNPTPGVDERFGYAVAAMENGYFAVGAPYDDTGAAEAGVAYLYNASGTLVATVTNPTPEAWELFGAAMCTVGGDTFVVTAMADNTGALAAGSVYLYSTNGTLLRTIPNPAPDVNDYFGSAVAAVGDDRLIIGASVDSTVVALGGSAYLVHTNGTLLQTITNPAPVAGDLFGNAVCAVGDDRLVIGAPTDISAADHTGRAYLYDTNGVMLLAITNPAAGSDDCFGSAMSSLGSKRFLTATPWHDTTLGNVGRAYVYDRDGLVVGTLENPEPTTSDYFGYAVAVIDSDLYLIGAPREDTWAMDAGTVYLCTLGPLLSGLVAQNVVDGAVSSVKLGNDSVISKKLADGAVVSSKIADGTIVDADISASADIDPAKIKGTAVTLNTTNVIGISPQGAMVYSTDTGLTFLRYYGSLQVVPTNTGTAAMIIPVTVPASVGGVARKVQSIDILYACTTAASYITDVRVAGSTAAGGSARTYIDSQTDRTSTSWTTITINAGTPQTVIGSLVVYVDMTFTGTGAGHTIYIGSIKLTLAP